MFRYKILWFMQDLVPVIDNASARGKAVEQGAIGYEPQRGNASSSE